MQSHGHLCVRQHWLQGLETGCSQWRSLCQLHAFCKYVFPCLSKKDANLARKSPFQKYALLLLRAVIFLELKINSQHFSEASHPTPSRRISFLKCFFVLPYIGSPSISSALPYRSALFPDWPTAPAPGVGGARDRGQITSIFHLVASTSSVTLNCKLVCKASLSRTARPLALGRA